MSVDWVDWNAGKLRAGMGSLTGKSSIKANGRPERKGIANLRLVMLGRKSSSFACV